MLSLLTAGTEGNSSAVIDFLEQYGEINCKYIIDCCESEFYQMLVVAYVLGSSVAKDPNII